MMKLASSLALAALVWGGAASADIAETETTRWQPSAGDVIAFDVLRKSNEFGTHEVRFDRAENGDLLVETEVSLRAGLGPITVFRYGLETEERWQDGTLVALTGSVNDDGDKESVRAALNGDVLGVAGDGFNGDLPLGILPASHWNVDQTTANQLLSSENGEVLEVNVIDEGRDTIEVAGEMLETNRFLMDSDIDVTLWYDDAGRWVKLAFEARGQAIEYVLKDLY